MAAESEPLIGIDLGTTNSVLATVQEGQPRVIKSRTGQALTPSVVALDKNGKRLVGHVARRQAITNPLDTLYALKRLIGRRFSSPQVQQALGSLPYQVVAGAHDDVCVLLGGRPRPIPEMCAMVLQELKADAEAHFGRPVTKAVITVPAYFSDVQRQATKDAGRIAGLEVLRIINEPTAAALAYGFNRIVEGRIAVLDLGGGTFDVSVLQVSQGIFDVVATGGDTWLGGEDWDGRIMQWLMDGFSREHKVDLRQDRMALQRLKDAAEKAKVELSSAREAQVNLPFIHTPPGKAALHLHTVLTRDKLEELTADLVQDVLRHADAVLTQARVRPSEFKEVLLVGGMTRMPRLVAEVKRHFGREPCKGVHPEEVVALGAAIQAHALMAQQGELLLLDVTPQSLGVVVAGGFMRKLIARNTRVPTSATQLFNTSKDNQESVRIYVVQGESDVAHHNELLGEFILGGLRKAPRGQVEIEVTFHINSEGLVSVSARDNDTGQQQSINASASAGLTEQELQRILAEQQQYLLAAQASDETRGRRAELEGLVREVADTLPRVRALASGGAFGMDVVRKAELYLEQARHVLEDPDLTGVSEAVDLLGRTLSVLRGLSQRLASG